MLYRCLVLLCVTVALGGCVTVSNTLSPDQVAGFRLVGTAVTFSPSALIWWGDGERAFAVSKGMSPLASETVAETAEARSYVRGAIAEKVRRAMERNLAGHLGGTRPVRLDVLVRKVRISSAVQRVIFGGNHEMEASVDLVDAGTGTTLLRFPAQSVQVPAGGGIAGVLVDNIFLKDPIDRVVENYASQYSNWLLHK